MRRLHEETFTLLHASVDSLRGNSTVGSHRERDVSGSDYYSAPSESDRDRVSNKRRRQKSEKLLQGDKNHENADQGTSPQKSPSPKSSVLVPVAVEIDDVEQLDLVLPKNWEREKIYLFYVVRINI